VDEAGWPGATEAAGVELGRRRQEQGEEAGRCFEQRREKGEFSLGMSVLGGLLHFAVAFACTTGAATVAPARKRRMWQGLQKPLESVLALYLYPLKIATRKLLGREGDKGIVTQLACLWAGMGVIASWRVWL
jgi:hypothetical protein